MSHFVDFILFFQRKKKFEIYCAQLTVDCYCSQLTVDCYCYCYYSPKLQYNNCIAIQSSTASSCNTNSATTHQVAIQSVYCNIMAQKLTSLLQYNSPSLAIQFSDTAHPILQYNPLLQYNFPSLAIQCHQTTHPGCNTIFLLQYNPKPTTPFSCNTIVIQFFFQPSLLQYNCNTIFFFPALSLAIQLQGCNTIFFFFHNTIWAVAHPNFCCIFFFVFFSLFFFSP